VDARKLSQEFSELLKFEKVTDTNIRQALSNYEKEMGPRTSNAVLESRKAADRFHAEDKFQIWTRNTTLMGVHYMMKHGNLLKRTAVIGIAVGFLFVAKYFHLEQLLNVA
jgi:hypothetical protein